MYINHRPAFGLDPYEIYNAFKTLNNKYNNENEDEEEHLPRHIFLDELQSRGEHMTDYELADCITHLLHTNHAVDEMSNEEQTQLIEKYLPEEVSVDRFMTDIIGIDTEDFDQILQTWERIRQNNTTRLHQSRKILTARSQE